MVDEFSEEDPLQSEADIMAVYAAMSMIELLEVAAAFCRDGERGLREGNVDSFQFCIGRLNRIAKVIGEKNAK